MPMSAARWKTASAPRITLAHGVEVADVTVRDLDVRASASGVS